MGLRTSRTPRRLVAQREAERPGPAPRQRARPDEELKGRPAPDGGDVCTWPRRLSKTEQHRRCSAVEKATCVSRAPRGPDRRSYRCTDAPRKLGRHARQGSGGQTPGFKSLRVIPCSPTAWLTVLRKAPFPADICAFSGSCSGISTRLHSLWGRGRVPASVTRRAGGSLRAHVLANFRVSYFA